MITDINQLDFSKRYTYADYLTWRFKERVELIMGRIFRMSPAPKSDHQLISTILSGEFYTFFKGKTCKVFSAPFDVRLPKNADDKDEQTETVVQPDICVICDPSKIDVKGCKGAPDLIAEIVSKSSVQKDLHEKYNLYESAGVKEYWIVHPNDKTLLIYILKNGTYHPSRIMTMGDVARSTVLPGFELDLNDVFQDVLKEPEEEYETNVKRLDP